MNRYHYPRQFAEAERFSGLLSLWLWVGLAVGSGKLVGVKVTECGSYLVVLGAGSLSFSFRTPVLLQLMLLPCCERVACICSRLLYFLGFRSRLNSVGVSV